MNAECVWVFNTSPGNKISISFDSFQLESSENCDRDYLEIRENSAIGKLIGTFCGTEISTVEVSNKLWMKFRSDSVGTEKGFMAQYTYLFGNEITGLSGEVASPMYPIAYRQDDKSFTWRITTEFGHSIKFIFDDLYVEYFGDSCYSKVKVSLFFHLKMLA